MARPCRIQFPNACHLAALQGVEGLALFALPRDGGAFVELMEMAARKHRVWVHAYAAAGNQALLLVETPDANLSAFMQGVQTAFSRFFRETRTHKGSVFQGRYHAKVVQKESFLGPVAAWVHALPARVLTARRSPEQVLKFLTAHPASSFSATQNADAAKVLPLDVSAVLKSYGSPVAKRSGKHAAECLRLLGEDRDSWMQLLNASPLALGDEAFIAQIEAQHHAVKRKRPPAGLRLHGRRKTGISRSRVLDAVADEFNVDRLEFFVQRHGSMLRPALSHALYRFAGLTQQEIATYLRLGSAAAVSLQIRRLLQAREKDPVLAKSLTRLEKLLAASA